MLMRCVYTCVVLFFLFSWIPFAVRVDLYRVLRMKLTAIFVYIFSLGTLVATSAIVLLVQPPCAFARNEVTM